MGVTRYEIQDTKYNEYGHRSSKGEIFEETEI
jgi:hypothetical protein